MPTKEQIEAIINELQKILRIQDWDIKLHMKNDEEMDSVCKRNFIPAGFCIRFREYKLARVYLNYEADQYKEDWYSVLIHEVYHIVFDDFDCFCDNLTDFMREELRDELQSDYELQKERLINQLARGFVNAYPASNFEHILNQEASKP